MKRMDRRQLREATAVIARLVRSKSNVTKRKPKEQAEAAASPEAEAKPHRPKGYRQVMHLGLGPKDLARLARLDKIVEAMKDDEGLEAMQLDLGREKAARLAIAWFAKNLPQQIIAMG